MMISLSPKPACLMMLLSFAAGVVQASPPADLNLTRWAENTSFKAQSVAFLPGSDGARRLAASVKAGLLLLDDQGRELAHMPGSFQGLDSRLTGSSVLVAALDNSRQQAMLTQLDSAKTQWSQPVYLPARDYSVAGLCLYRDDASNLFVFLVGEEGKGEQWLVGGGDRLNHTPRLVRNLPLPPNAEFCQVDDAAHRLFVNEENIGWWAYPAHPEADVTRQPVALREPFGELKQAAGAMAVVPGGLLALDPKGKSLHLYQQQGLQQGWTPVADLSLMNLKKPEGLSAREDKTGLQLLVNDNDGERLYQGALSWTPQPVAVAAPLPSVMPISQSQPVGRQGDAADDPAIWVNPQNPALSRVLGTNKKQGLLAYDLSGKQLQELPVGRLNNVDIRPGFMLGKKQVDLAVASNRDRNSLSLFSIDRTSGMVREVGEIPTPLAEIYGVCLFKPASGELYAFANGKDGSFLQYRLSAADGKARGELVRRFKVETQPEGCVADDQRQRLFLGEEDVGVWEVDARADQPATLSSVIKVGDAVHADVEGLALYQSDSHDYLVISSQGNDSYVVVDAEPPYALRGAFRVGLNAGAGIDGTSETDGIELTSMNLGGPWSRGMLVVQDGRKRMPEQAQNFKFVPWAEVMKTLALP
ncbi:Phytase domain-containing protein [Pseudomonas syringae pv. cilantro]|uniref:Phytase domain-containing protein n=2 Tax=Pseudomonas syringae group TaxID=136849 RepID=A0A0N1JPI5_PSESX|nr:MULTISPECIES: phytase [Pseudomonas syringae group]KPC33705.1 Phytase domain-containing protein [Pseudomonas syringae pv. cilantro]KPW79956.1 Phytase domain-containing protein [Pseudomonas syringae pv. coriandricola]RMN14316.1 Phytase domain-containing protein [Pseudomonas syringae pv. coriandricola]